MKRFIARINTRMGFFFLLVFLFWLKTLLAYFADFSLGVTGIYQWFILLINPLATTFLLFGLALYVKKAKIFYPLILLIDFGNTLLLYLNVIYYREFTDFMTINTMLGYSKVNQGLSGSSLALTEPHDLLFWLDIVIILVLMLMRKIKMDQNPLPKRIGFQVTSLSALLFGFNLLFAEIDRPQLITRTFDRSYIVKYLGIDTFTVYDGAKTEQTSKMRSSATKSELKNVEKYVHGHYAKPNKKYYGEAKGKNIIIIHLESFQQFLIDDKIEGQTVTPFLNSLYHSKSTYSFSNFFNQVGQGKTSDAENMLETGTFGLPQGSLFAQLGSDQTFQAAPAILKQKQGYSSAVFHGNVASFWNRNNVYKNMGYQYFFSASYYDTSGDKATGYGLKDKLLFKDSIKYLQTLQQPFYAKYITVSNHFPFDLDKEDSNFKVPNTGNTSVNNYFRTANYLDQSVKEFFAFLKKSGLYDNSVIVLYGDHYGISDSANKDLAKTFSQDPSHFSSYGNDPADNWDDWDDTQLQRVPFMIHVPGAKNGGIQKQYGGEIDVLPTLLHLVGINSKPYMQFGTDLFSSQHDQVVAFRNQDFITPNYSSVGGTIYNNATGQIVTPTGALKKQITKDQKAATTQLTMSDSLNEKNLLRFYTPKGFKKVNSANYNYSDGLQKELAIQKKLGLKSTSMYSKNRDRSLEDLYKTDAPEATHSKSKSNRIEITNPDSTSGN
ncbi:Lipoteichoic acid synthase LtaS Type IIb [Pediococcus damnosus]|uniref:Lipoteichoic acid synthase LtaS Type IIb n=2 Tax=Pediococcus damnosus TaxID=51663 RepID=A0ABM6A2P7_9LACO|nr:LTA synthase family protein [Pediococcus damnosus]AMV66588.1 Lipoteichoic acid synthase LtaS Type IIb [Pediococcus damnosus]AMV68877.1 Lipoteichoic acid synthase LtaS Type IIb [Pediococcus damnosus]KJU75059.1 alkaline phosphatase [Pediococcus damnosus LMG 28219]KRN52387.1 phosphoglycerol transferase alkaline phosphatase superfamily protein [Pediococcus damnosus]PIO85764.1 alkaline phosphatase [Pediococcus damnosus]